MSLALLIYISYDFPDFVYLHYDIFPKKLSHQRRRWGYYQFCLQDDNLRRKRLIEVSYPHLKKLGALNAITVFQGFLKREINLLGYLTLQSICIYYTCYVFRSWYFDLLSRTLAQVNCQKMFELNCREFPLSRCTGQMVCYVARNVYKVFQLGLF